jgi:RND family efflux transporter MFP subunit
VQAAEAQVAIARAQSAGAGESAARATITSPINGVVSARAVNGGEAVNVGVPLFTVVNASELELAGQVGVREAALVRVGQPVSFTLDGFPSQVLQGRVARIDPTADPGTRQVGVYIRLPNPGNRIVGGQFAHGTIASGTEVTAVVIPQSAVASRSGDNAVVFVVTGNKLVKRTVVLGAADAATGAVAVATGIAAGERVLLNPTTDTRDGAIVTISSQAPADAPARAVQPDSAK